MKETIRMANNTRMFEYMSMAVLTVDQHARILFVNAAFEQIYGYSRQSLLSKHIKTIVADQLKNLFVGRSLGNVAKPEHRIHETWVRKFDGERISCKIMVDTFFDESEKQQGYILTFNLVSANSNTDLALEQMAYQDDLTGLANRALFNQLLRYEISQAEREDTRFALLFLDLDKFKQINDELGHETGDLLLCEVARTLENCVRKTDVVGRFGGDEFVIILNRLLDTDTVANVVEKIIREIKKIDAIAGHGIEISCSIGISLYPENAQNMPLLTQNADAAMYRAKKQGGNSFYYFDADINQEMLDYQNAKKRIENGAGEW